MRYQRLPYDDSLDVLHQEGLLYYGMVGQNEHEWYRLFPHQLSPSECHTDPVTWRYAIQVED